MIGAEFLQMEPMEIKSLVSIEKTHIIHFKDINYTILATPSEYACDFTVYQIVGEDECGSFVYNKKESGVGEFVFSTKDAEIFLYGYIKWDGCSNWYFDAQDNVMIHFGRVNEAKNIGVLFDYLYRIAEMLIPAYDVS